MGYGPSSDPNYHRKRMNKWRGEGRKAAALGQPVSSNPYRGSWAANNWRIGYDDRVAEDRKLHDAAKEVRR